MLDHCNGAPELRAADPPPKHGGDRRSADFQVVNNDYLKIGNKERMKDKRANKLETIA
jgi:hypothetical protein